MNCHSTLCNIQEERIFHKIHSYVLKTGSARVLLEWPTQWIYEQQTATTVLAVATVWPVRRDLAQNTQHILLFTVCAIPTLSSRHCAARSRNLMSQCT